MIKARPVNAAAVYETQKKLREATDLTARMLRTYIPPITRTEFQKANNSSRRAVGLRPDESYPLRGKVVAALSAIGLNQLAEATAHPTVGMLMKKGASVVLGALHEVPEKVSHTIDDAVFAASSIMSVRAPRNENVSGPVQPTELGGKV